MSRFHSQPVESHTNVERTTLYPLQLEFYSYLPRLKYGVHQSLYPLKIWGLFWKLKSTSRSAFVKCVKPVGVGKPISWEVGREAARRFVGFSRFSAQLPGLSQQSHVQPATSLSNTTEALPIRTYLVCCLSFQARNV